MIVTTMSRKPKVLLNQDIPRESEGFRLLQEACDLDIYDEKVGGSMRMSREELIERAKGVDALYVVLPTQVDAELLDAIGPQLKVIGTQSVGLDHIDIDECKRRNVQVGYTPDVLTEAVAEATVALTLATARRYQEGRQAVVYGDWGSTWDNSLYLCGKDIRNSTVGILGLGRIGLAVAKRLVPFGISKLLYNNRLPKIHAAEVNAEYVTFGQLLEQSDFVIACCSVNASNQNLFNADAFKKMKNSAIFINTTRGALVNQDDLYEALLTGEIWAAGLDVTSPEPLPTDHKLLTLANCTIVPHLGSASVSARLAMVDLTVRNILAGLQGEALPAPVPNV